MARLNPISVVRQRRARNGPMFRGVRDNRGLTASAATMDLNSRTEARRVKYLRARWQEDAYTYRDMIGEIGFAQRFLANCAGRMKIYPAIYPVGTYDQDPVPLNDEEAGPIPPQILDAAQNSMASFASGRVAMSDHMESVSAQLSMVGEGYIIGTTDTAGNEAWNVRSIDEIMVKNDSWFLREVPTNSNDAFGWEPLDDPTNTYIARFWTPHPRFKVMADSSMRGILDSCVAGFTRVDVVGRGPTPIEDIAVGDEVWARKGSEMVRRPVLRHLPRGHRDTIVVSTRNHALTCTPDHKMLRLVADGLGGKGNAWTYRVEEVLAGDLRPGDLLPVAREIPDSGTTDLDPGLAWFLGAMLGDGHVEKTGYSFCLFVEGVVADRARRVVRDLWGLESHDTTASGHTWLKWHSADVVCYLRSVGLGVRATAKRVPEVVRSAGWKAQEAYLEGYVDTDGHRSNRGYLAFAAANEELIRDVRAMYRAMGVPVSNIHVERDRQGAMRSLNRLNKYVITEALPLWRFDAYVSRKRGFNVRSKNANFTNILGPMFTVARVASIVSGPTIPVFDIDVADAHTFIADGIAIHNCEELLILRKTIRATGRSRLMSGILKWPKGLNVMGMPNDNRDPVATPEIKAVTDAMMAPIVDEGVASAIVPLLVSGEEAPLAGLQFMPFDRPFDAVVLARIEALIGYMANGLDLPAQVLTGIEDANHWSAWLIDDNTFRYHVEPHVRRCVDALAVGFLRAAIMGADEVQELDPLIVRQFAARICVWYDPVELVTHPDKTQNALNLYDRKELSGPSLRAAVGFTEDDKPSATEFVARLISSQRTWPANVSLAVVAREDPSLTIPPITAAGMVPGIRAGMVQEAVAPPVPGTPPELPPGAPTPPEPTSPPVAPPAPEAAPQPVRGPAQSTPPGMVADDVTTMAVHPLGQAHPRLTPKARQLSAKLTGIDRDLRARLQVLASTTITRALERAGAQLRTKVRGSRALTASIRPVSNTRVAFTLGPEVSAQYGLDPRATSADLTELKPTFEAWVMQAQEGALATAHQLAGSGGSTAKLTAARAEMATAREKAWTYFAAQLQTLYEAALFKAQPSIDKGTQAPLDPETVVPTGVVRRTLAVAGGLSPTSKAVTAVVAAAFVPPVAPIPTAADDADDAGEAEAVTDAGVDTTTEGLGAGVVQGIVAQIGGGPIVSDLLSAAGSELANYTWVHGGGSPNPFEPHDDLDGQDFTNWDDDVLAVAGDWDPSGTGFYTPGDHDGCGCDFQVNMTEGTDTADTDDEENTP